MISQCPSCVVRRQQFASESERPPVWEIAVHLLSLVMSMMVSFVLSFFPRDVLDEILKLIESVSEDFPSYSFRIVYS